MRCSIAWFFVILIVALAALPAAAPAAGNQPDYEPLQTCLTAAPDYSPIYPTDVFPVGTEVDAVFHDLKGHTLKHEWFAVDTGGAIAANTSLVSGTVDVTNMNKGVLRFGGSQKPGKYRVDVSIDGAPWKSASFTISPPLAAPSPQSPKDLLPLTKGTNWTYDYVQKAFNGAKLTPPDGITPEPDGSLHFPMTVAVLGDEAPGTKLETCRKGQPVYDEWNQLGSSGYVMMQRKTGDNLEVYKPPMVAWPWPLTPASWTYESDDHSVKQSYEMWGPLPVESPQGVVPGYVIAIQQDTPPTHLTLEHHFVPGVGLTKEITLTTYRDLLVCREEMTLTQMKN